jgi:NAD+ kinase
VIAAIVANIQKEGARTILPHFTGMLEKEGIETVLHEDIRTILGDGYRYEPECRLFDGAGVIISFGGDGTILYTARISRDYGIPILGVNLGKVGFLAELSPDEIDQIPARLKSGDFEIIERLSFDVGTSGGKRYFALNDIVLDRNIDTRLLRLTVSIDGHFAAEVQADGLIISTPTGSTAHSMAAGGPIVMPECSAIVLSPICPHSLTMRPMIVDGSKIIRVKVVEGDARMAVDGQSFVAVPADCEVTVGKAEQPVRVARLRGKTYFDILHTRLKWGVSLKMRNA